ncbi:hypothetical protein BDZ91DRAFT_717255 [Kalaharituber pfeilii]|nr:hypothetical protein BDZ91DRAFT_717255 [Kalaharituber pfeilii]
MRRSFTYWGLLSQMTLALMTVQSIEALFIPPSLTGNANQINFRLSIGFFNFTSLLTFHISSISILASLDYLGLGMAAPVRRPDLGGIYM